MKSVLLVGLGRFGIHIAAQLNELGHQIMAIDRDEALVNEALPLVEGAEIGDSTDEEFMRSLGIRNFDVCIVTIADDFKSSLETTLLIKELGAKMVVSRATTDIHARLLLKNGADEIIYPEKQLAKWVAIRYTADNVVDYIQLDARHYILEVRVPDAWLGSSIGQLDIRRKYNINIMGVKLGDDMNISVSPDMILSNDCTLLVLGEYRTLQKCFKL